MTDFSNYELNVIAESERGVYELAEGLLPEMAEVLDHDIGEVPTMEAIQGFIGKFGPDKELQKNISLVKDLVSVNTAADWVERSGALTPVARAFKDNSPIPEEVSMAMFAGGVASWMLRRATVLERVNPDGIGAVWLVGSDRKMGDAEHPMVKTLKSWQGEATEASFMKLFIEPRLKLTGFEVRTHHAEGLTNGDEVLDNFIGERISVGILDIFKSILVATNAPNSVQATAQIREALQRISEGYDTDETQLFMISDSIPVARKGEGRATHQDPHSALGQLARNALFLHKAAAQPGAI